MSLSLSQTEVPLLRPRHPHTPSWTPPSSLRVSASESDSSKQAGVFLPVRGDGLGGGARNAPLQPCSRAATQPRSHAALQPCSHAALQPCAAPSPHAQSLLPLQVLAPGAAEFLLQSSSSLLEPSARPTAQERSVTLENLAWNKELERIPGRWNSRLMEFQVIGIPGNWDSR